MGANAIAPMSNPAYYTGKLVNNELNKHITMNYLFALSLKASGAIFLFF